MKLWIFQIDEHVVYSLMCMKCNMCTSLVPEHTSDKSLDSPFLPDLAFLTPVMFSHCKYLMSLGRSGQGFADVLLV